jgi:hypothetical protein
LAEVVAFPHWFALMLLSTLPSLHSPLTCQAVPLLSRHTPRHSWHFRFFSRT